MFEFIKNKLFKKKINDCQFRQKIIFINFADEEYFDSNKTAINLCSDFETKFSDEILTIIVEDMVIQMDLNLEKEAIIYLVNFLQAMELKQKDTYFLVEATDNPNYIINVTYENDKYINFVSYNNLNSEKRFINVKIEKDRFEKEFINVLNKKISYKHLLK